MYENSAIRKERAEDPRVRRFTDCPRQYRERTHEIHNDANRPLKDRIFDMINRNQVSNDAKLIAMTNMHMAYKIEYLTRILSGTNRDVSGVAPVRESEIAPNLSHFDIH